MYVLNDMALAMRLRPYKQLSILLICCFLALFVIFQALSTTPNDVIISNSALPSLPRAPEIHKLDVGKLSFPRKEISLDRAPIVGAGTARRLSTNRTRIRAPTRQEIANLYKEDVNKIPRIIHLTWKNRLLPKWTNEWLTKWREINPEWQIWFWSDQAADIFMKTKFPSYYPMYIGYKSNIQRADAMRYFILHEFGGFYADLDVEPLRSLEALRSEQTCVLSSEPQLHARFCYRETSALALLGNRVACNAVMACRRRHPFFKYVMDMLSMVSEDGNPLLSTGPMMLTYRLIAFDYFVANVLGKSPHRLLENQVRVHLAPDHWFMPTHDPMQDGNLKNQCARVNLDQEQISLCARIKEPNFVNGPRDTSLTNHHWVHTWITGTKHANDPSTVNIIDLVPDVVFPEVVLTFREEF